MKRGGRPPTARRQAFLLRAGALLAADQAGAPELADVLTNEMRWQAALGDVARIRDHVVARARRLASRLNETDQGATARSLLAAAMSLDENQVLYTLTCAARAKTTGRTASRRGIAAAVQKLADLAPTVDDEGLVNAMSKGRVGPRNAQRLTELLIKLEARLPRIRGRLDALRKASEALGRLSRGDGNQLPPQLPGKRPSIPSPLWASHRHCAVVGPQGWSCHSIPPRKTLSAADASCFAGHAHEQLHPPCRCRHRRCIVCDVGREDGDPFVSPVIVWNPITGEGRFLGFACQAHTDEVGAGGKSEDDE